MDPINIYDIGYSLLFSSNEIKIDDKFVNNVKLKSKINTDINNCSHIIDNSALLDESKSNLEFIEKMKAVYMNPLIYNGIITTNLYNDRIEKFPLDISHHQLNNRTSLDLAIIDKILNFNKGITPYYDRYVGAQYVGIRKFLTIFDQSCGAAQYLQYRMNDIVGYGVTPYNINQSNINLDRMSVTLIDGKNIFNDIFTAIEEKFRIKNSFDIIFGGGQTENIKDLSINSINVIIENKLLLELTELAVAQKFIKPDGVFILFIDGYNFDDFNIIINFGSQIFDEIFTFRPITVDPRRNGIYIVFHKLKSYEQDDRIIDVKKLISETLMSGTLIEQYNSVLSRSKNIMCFDSIKTNINATIVNHDKVIANIIENRNYKSNNHRFWVHLNLDDPNYL